jgi:hypothetical protein
VWSIRFDESHWILPVAIVGALAAGLAIGPNSHAMQSGNTSPASPAASADPATATFSTDFGLLLVAVKPDKTADYEAAIVALQEALSSAADEETRTLAASWRVFKSADLDAKANAIFVHLLQPAIAGVDYRPSLWLDKLLEGAPAELLAKYRESIASGPTKLPLVEFANMSVKPTPKPVNQSPAAPPPPQKPSNGSPTAVTPVR